MEPLCSAVLLGGGAGGWGANLHSARDSETVFSRVLGMDFVAVKVIG